jgi:hypothetical protein
LTAASTQAVLGIMTEINATIKGLYGKIKRIAAGPPYSS